MNKYIDFNKNVTTGERIIALLTYLTSGAIGVIWIILSAVTKKNLKPFIKYHAYQSVFLSIIIYLLLLVFGIITNIVGVIPFIGSFMRAIIFYFADMPVIMGLSIVNSIIVVLYTYLIGNAVLGRYSYVPFISDIVEGMM